MEVAEGLVEVEDVLAELPTEELALETEDDTTEELELGWSLGGP